MVQDQRKQEEYNMQNNLKKYKISRRLGVPLFEKCQSPKYALALARKEKNMTRTSRRPRNLSEYGTQLMEKQKVRYLYNISEANMKKYIQEAERKAVGEQKQEVFLQLLENRLDNIVYRAGFAPTRQMARQLVSHGHFLLNGRKVKVPSIQVRTGDSVVVRDGSKGSKAFSIIKKTITERAVPKFLKSSPEKLEISVVEQTTIERKNLVFDIARVFEYYSR